ncbi:MAG: tetratricopeptide repeat protein [Myxococcales bacterium]|nr:tetratricopeptide repeat protein [Myxococcales bacterium]
MALLNSDERPLTDSLELRICYAEVLCDTGRPQAALRELARAFAAYRDRGRLLAAVTICRRARELAPDDPAWSVHLAEMYTRLHQEERAAEVLAEAHRAARTESAQRLVESAQAGLTHGDETLG